jgi:hypothetical protein
MSDVRDISLSERLLDVTNPSLVAGRALAGPVALDEGGGPRPLAGERGSHLRPLRRQRFFADPSICAYFARVDVML